MANEFKFYSPYIDSDFSPENKNLFDTSTAPLVVELRKLAAEVCMAFGLQVRGASQLGAFRPNVRFVTKSGINCGTAALWKDDTKNGKDVYRYHVSFPTINKDKSSAHSDRDARDSNNIASLIRTIKKNKEEPTEAKLLNSFESGMSYPLRAVEGHSRRGMPTVNLTGKLALSVTRYVLGVDEQKPSMYIGNLQEIFDEYQSKMKLYEESVNDVARYRKGMTMVCIDKSSNVPFYLVGDVTVENVAGIDKWKFQDGVKRYSSLRESPLAPIVAMVRAYMDGRPTNDPNNDLGVPSADEYYPDIDIATGYNRHIQLWVAIPKHAE